MTKTAFNPDGLPVPRGSYSLVNIAQPGRMVFIAGQTASDHDGQVVGVGDAKAQTVLSWGRFNARSKPPGAQSMISSR
jgi:enamine deaminase RidA (YjgF/YER057c/UK114 family)